MKDVLSCIALIYTQKTKNMIVIEYLHVSWKAIFMSDHKS